MVLYLRKYLCVHKTLHIIDTMESSSGVSLIPRSQAAWCKNLVTLSLRSSQLSLKLNTSFKPHVYPSNLEAEGPTKETVLGFTTYILYICTIYFQKHSTEDSFSLKYFCKNWYVFYIFHICNLYLLFSCNFSLYWPLPLPVNK